MHGSTAVWTEKAMGRVVIVVIIAYRWVVSVGII